MKLFATYLLLSFIGISVFGFIGLTNHESLFSKCVTATIPGGLPCASNVHDAAMSILHAQIFQSFSVAILIALALLALMVYTLLHSVSLLLAESNFQPISYYEYKLHSSILKQNRWSIFRQQHPGHA